MRKSTMTTWFAAIVSVGASMVVGCADAPRDESPQRPEVSTVKEGLTVLAAKPAWGLSAAFRKADRMVFVETRVGELKPEAYRKAFPDEPEREMDLRIVDSEGRTFFVIKGGDEFADPTWAKDIAEHATKGNDHLAHRVADYSLAEEAADEIVKVESAPEFAPHTFHLKSIVSFTPAKSPIVQEHLKELETIKSPAVLAKGDGAIQPYNANDYQNYMYADVYSKTIFLVANHSATTGRNFGNKAGVAVLDETFINCNHGTCSNGGMGFRHSAESGWIAGNKSLASFFNSESSTTTGNVWGSCATKYNWNTPPGHDCNDDSAYQMWQVRYQSRGGVDYNASGDSTHFFVVDSSSNWFACDCSYTGKCNDWSVPKKPHY